MPASDYTTFRGRRCCVCLAKWLPVFEQMLLREGVIKASIDIAQLTGGASASAGTHSEGGAFDVWQRDPVTVRIARQMGAWAWARTKAQGFDPHLHGVLVGCPHNTPARYQITAGQAGFNGLGHLGRGARDDGAPMVTRNWEQGITWAVKQIASGAAAGVIIPDKPKDWFDMATEEQLRKIIGEEVDRRMGDVVPSPDWADAAYKKKNPNWFLSSYVRWTAHAVYRIEKKLGEVLAAVKK